MCAPNAFHYAFGFV